MSDFNRGTPPANGTCWIVTYDGEAVEVTFSDASYFWTRQPVWARIDGEVGAWAPDEIEGWSKYSEVAESHAAAILEQYNGS